MPKQITGNRPGRPRAKKKAGSNKPKPKPNAYTRGKKRASRQTKVGQTLTLAPQEGPQSDFLSSSADIVIYGGAAGGGKTYGLLLETARNLNVPGFGATIFRRTNPQIRSQGALWDESMNIFPHLDGRPNESRLYWRFPSGAEIQFRTLEYENDKVGWMGSQICLICFDELTHFSKETFFYMLSRNRSICGIKPYVRCTCNPDSDNWVRDFIDWWIDEDGFPIKERSGVVRYFARYKDNMIWGSSKNELLKNDAEFVSQYNSKKEEYLEQKKELKKKYDAHKGKIKSCELSKYFKITDAKEELCFSAALDLLKGVYTTALYGIKNRASEGIKSFTFISANVHDNPILLKTNPGYLGNLKSLPLVERRRLLGGNWNVRAEAGKFLNRDWYELVDASKVPKKGRECRFFDFAATKPSRKNRDPDATVGVKIRKCGNVYYVIDLVKARDNPAKIQELFLKTVALDKRIADDLGNEYLVRWEEEPGSSGKSESYRLQTLLAGFNCKGVSTGGKNKEARARAFAIQSEIGNVKMVNAPWTKDTLTILHNFTDSLQEHDDEVDGCSGAFNELTSAYIHPTLPDEEEEEVISWEERAKERAEAYSELQEAFLMGEGEDEDW